MEKKKKLELIGHNIKKLCKQIVNVEDRTDGNDIGLTLHFYQSIKKGVIKNWFVIPP